MTHSHTKRIILISILSAISVVLFQFTKFPLPWTGAFMKVDTSILPILIGLFILGLPSAFAILVIRSILKLILFNEGPNDWIGLPMNIIAMGLFIWMIWLFMKNSEEFNLRKFLIGSGLGTICLTIAMVILNYVYAIPLYEKFMHFSLSSIGMNLMDWIVGMTIPFNILQGIILSVIIALVMIPFKPFMKQQRLKFK